MTQRKKTGNLVSGNSSTNGSTDIDQSRSNQTQQDQKTWKRILLLIVAITIHNIPGKTKMAISCLVTHSVPPSME